MDWRTMGINPHGPSSGDLEFEISASDNNLQKLSHMEGIPLSEAEINFWREWKSQKQ